MKKQGFNEKAPTNASEPSFSPAYTVPLRYPNTITFPLDFITAPGFTSPSTTTFPSNSRL